MATVLIQEILYIVYTLQIMMDKACVSPLVCQWLSLFEEMWCEWRGWVLETEWVCSRCAAEDQHVGLCTELPAKDLNSKQRKFQVWWTTADGILEELHGECVAPLLKGFFSRSCMGKCGGPLLKGFFSRSWEVCCTTAERILLEELDGEVLWTSAEVLA